MTGGYPAVRFWVELIDERFAKVAPMKFIGWSATS